MASMTSSQSTHLSWARPGPPQQLRSQLEVDIAARRRHPRLSFCFDYALEANHAETRAINNPTALQTPPFFRARGTRCSESLLARLLRSSIIFSRHGMAHARTTVAQTVSQLAIGAGVALIYWRSTTGTPASDSVAAPGAPITAIEAALEEEKSATTTAKLWGLVPPSPTPPPSTPAGPG